MPADEVTHGADVDESRVRTGPRHAAPKKPLFTRFHMPAGKAIAMAAMPTAVLMGMGFTSSLALADSGGSTPTAKSLTADEYKNCVAALDGSSASPSPSASASTSAPADQATPSPSASTGTSKDSSATGTGSGTASSSDSGSDDKATPSPSATDGSSKDTSGDTATPSPSASASSSSGGGLLGDLGDAITGIFTGGSGSDSGSSPSASPSPSASASSSSSDTSTKDSSTSTATGTVKDTTKKVTDTVKKTTDTATDAAKDVTKSVEKAAETATSSPSPSASSSTDAQNCPAATEDVSGVDNKVPVADDPWYLNASSLLLKGADYQGVVEVKTAGGTTKKVLKYVISGGTDIGDLHQTVKDKQQGKTYHVQAGSGTTSTIRNGDTTMYTESISGNLFGLIPITFSPDNPPPLNIPLIYFTNVKVVQAAQFGGTLHVPGMHVYTTDGTG
ncbi:hypothetical protein ACIRP3_43860 [Streptomyces sp. NPDC101209]|uniref:hypothetical protein n=1 Tax=Streptomyces sp. NPDC101209 TaxID=3366129 RepID=UPI00380C9FFC